MRALSSFKESKHHYASSRRSRKLALVTRSNFTFPLKKRKFEKRAHGQSWPKDVSSAASWISPWRRFSSMLSRLGLAAPDPGRSTRRSTNWPSRAKCFEPDNGQAPRQQARVAAKSFPRRKAATATDKDTGEAVAQGFSGCRRVQPRFPAPASPPLNAAASDNLSVTPYGE
jgi:hypothetical protein